MTFVRMWYKDVRDNYATPLKVRTIQFGTHKNKSGDVIWSASKKQWTLKINKMVCATLSDTDALDYVNDISRMYAGNNYRDVLDNPEWQTFYSVQKRNLPRMDAHNNVVQKNTTSMPCYDCRYLFPKKNITIDHQRPQSGGETEAVAKVFRALGLTKNKPIGEKGLSIFNDSGPVEIEVEARQARGYNDMRTKSNTVGTTRTALMRRYTLDDTGTLLYSIFAKKSYMLDELEKACMHSILNLKPLCGSCNSSRSNATKL